jgi:hypothetical protein
MGTMDDLEQFIKSKREELDKYDPSAEVWKRILRAIKPVRRSVRLWLSAAAMITVVIGTTFVLLIINQNKNLPDSAGKTIQQALKETEMYYNTQVNTLYREAKPLLTGQPEVEKELENDLSRIDNICHEIKKDLKDNVANQEVIEALIQNYTIKIRILEDMLTTLKEKENNTEKRKSHEL